MVCIDLNPDRANIAASPEESGHTSVQSWCRVIPPSVNLLGAPAT